MKSLKKTRSKKLIIAGSFANDINKLKREFWLNSVEARTYFEEIHVLVNGRVNVDIGSFKQAYFPGWLWHTKFNWSRFFCGAIYFLILLLQSPKFIYEVVALEYKTLPFSLNWHPVTALKLSKTFITCVCGLGLVFRTFIRLDLSAQDTVVVWSEHVTGMRLLKRKVRRSGARLILSEYGELPGTMFICDRGMFHESWPLLFKEKFSALPVSIDEVGEMKKHIHNIVNECISSKVGQYDANSNLEAINLPKGKPVIYVNGVQAHASGLLPRSSKFSHEYSPYFGSNYEMLKYFANLAKKNDWIIIFKDHPNTCNYFPGQEICDGEWGEHVKILGNIDIYKIFTLADLTVSLGSKTVYLSLLNQVPVYLMGPYSINSDDLSCGLYTGGMSEEAIISAVEAAQNHGVDVEGLTVYLTRMMKYFYYSMDDDSNSLFGRGRQQFWKDFLDYMKGGRSFISAKVKVME